MKKGADVYQLIYESNLDSKLEQILIGLVKDNPSPKIESIIQKFLLYVQHSTENFWTTYYNAKTYEEKLDCYYQYSKNQCLATEVLVRDLGSLSSDDEINENLDTLVKESFTF
jgi:predicted metalloprotease